MDINFYYLLAIFLLSGIMILWLFLPVNKVGIIKRWQIWLFKNPWIWIIVILINVISGIYAYISGEGKWYVGILMAIIVGLIYIFRRQEVLKGNDSNKPKQQ